MSKVQYVLTKDELIICDEEMGLDLALPFSLPRLPADLKAEGVVLERDPQGTLLSAYCVHEGRRHGQCRLFSEEGKVRAEMFYLHGALHGPSIMYGEKAEILAESWYCDGKRIGKAHFYFPSGALSSVQRFRAGEWDGVQEYFYEGGAKKSLLPFRQGKLHGEVLLFWESGALKRSVRHEAGLREGEDKLWNEQGVLIDEGEYRAGAPCGIHRRYFAEGAPREEVYYHTPTRFDRMEWHPSGKLIFEGKFAPDLTYTEKVSVEPHGHHVRKGVWDGNRIRWK